MSMIRPATIDDASQVAAIYNYFIANTVVTFEEVTVSDDVMSERISHGQSVGRWIVAESGGEVHGFSYAMPFAARSAYRRSVETTVYVAHDHLRRGYGIKLYNSLFEHLRSDNLHCTIAIIALPNQESVALHEKLGFIKVGELSEVGWKFGRWVNVGYWQLLF
jgi:L-amino acid N-acyltransferase YncA